MKRETGARLQQSQWHTEPATKGKIYLAPYHDYTWRGVYMYTLTLKRGVPAFSTVSGTPHLPVVTLSDFGRAAEQLILAQPSFFPCHIIDYVLMPDHIHLLFAVTRTLDRHVGHEMGALEGAIKRALLSLHPHLADTWRDVKIFDGNRPHDRIVKDDGQLQTCQRYVRDNPRRLLVRRLYPDLFRVYNHLRVGDREMAAYGNIFLLRDFQKKAVRIHRRWSQGELEAYIDECLAVTANGGVLVSPWIHPWERDIRDRAIALGGRIVTVRADGFRDRFKPCASEFALCQQGRLLLLAPWSDRPADTVTRREALSLNDLAAALAAVNADTPMSLAPHKR